MQDYHSLSLSIQLQIISLFIQLILRTHFDQSISTMKLINKIVKSMGQEKDPKKYQMRNEVEIVKKLLMMNNNKGNNKAIEMYRIDQMLQRHFKGKIHEKFMIQLVIFVKNETNYQKQDKHIIQRWMFNSHKVQTYNKQPNKHILNHNYPKNDLILTILLSLQNHHHQASQDRNQLDYELIIKSYETIKNSKQKTYVLHHTGKQVNLKVYRHHFSILQYQEYWEKQVNLCCGDNDISRGKFMVGCYKNGTYKEKQINKQDNNNKLCCQQQQPEKLPVLNIARKFSLQALTAESVSSFKSLKLNFSCKLNNNTNNNRKNNSNNNNTKQVHHRLSNNLYPSSRQRIHSIYQSKDEQTGVWIISPRKLSEQQSPKIKYFQQKTVKFTLEQHNFTNNNVVEQLMLEDNYEDIKCEQVSEEMSEGSQEFELVEESYGWGNQKQEDKDKCNETNNRVKANIQKIDQQMYQAVKFVDELISY